MSTAEDWESGKLGRNGKYVDLATVSKKEIMKCLGLAKSEDKPVKTTPLQLPVRSAPCEGLLIKQNKP